MATHSDNSGPSSPEPVWLGQLRSKLMHVPLPDAYSSVPRGSLGHHPFLIDQIINATRQACEQHEFLSRMSSNSLSYGFAPLPQLVQRALQAEAARSSATHEQPSINKAFEHLLYMLTPSHSFMQFTTVPRALFHHVSGPQKPDGGLSAIAGYVQGNAEKLFYGLDNPQSRADTIIRLVKAITNDEDARNPYTVLSADIKLLALQRAMIIAASPAIAAERLTDYLRPYGTLMHRLIAQAQRPDTPEFMLRHDGDPRHRIFQEQSEAAIARVMGQIRSIVHMKNHDINDEWHSTDSDVTPLQTLGSAFDTQCNRLEEQFRHVLAHPSLTSYPADVLVQVLEPIAHHFTTHIEGMRTAAATHNPRVARGLDPFLTPQVVNSLITYIEQHYIQPQSAYASSGAILQAMFASRMAQTDIAEPFRLKNALNQLVDYCREHKSTLFSSPTGSAQPQATHKLDLLTSLADRLADLQDTPSLSLAQRGTLFVAAIDYARQNGIKQHEWEQVLTLTNDTLFHQAGISKPATGWEPLFAQGTSAATPAPALASSGPTAEAASALPSNVVRHSAVGLSEVGKKNFADRMKAAAKKQAKQERPSPEAGPSQEKLATDGHEGEKVVSFADRLKAKKAEKEERDAGEKGRS